MRLVLPGLTGGPSSSDSWAAQPASRNNPELICTFTARQFIISYRLAADPQPNIYIYYTKREIPRANTGFGSANIQRNYTVQPLIEQLSLARGDSLLIVEDGRINGGKSHSLLDLFEREKMKILNKPETSM